MRADQRNGARRGFYFGGTFLVAFLGHVRLRVRKPPLLKTTASGGSPRIAGLRPLDGEMLAPLACHCKPWLTACRKYCRHTVKGRAVRLRSLPARSPARAE